MLKKWLISSGVIAALAGVGLVGYRTGHGKAASDGLSANDKEAARSAVGRTSSDDDALNERVERLGRQVTALAGAVARLPEAESPKPAELVAVPRGLTREDVEESQVEWRTHMDEVRERFVAEPRQAAWADKARTALDDALESDAELGRLVRNIECRSTTCRVEFIDNTEPDFSGKVSTLFTRVGHLLPSMEADFADNPDGTRSASIYLSTDTTTSDG